MGNIDRLLYLEMYKEVIETNKCEDCVVTIYAVAYKIRIEQIIFEMRTALRKNLFRFYHDSLPDFVMALEIKLDAMEKDEKQIIQIQLIDYKIFKDIIEHLKVSVNMKDWQGLQKAVNDGNNSESINKKLKELLKYAKENGNDVEKLNQTNAEILKKSKALDKEFQKQLQNTINFEQRLRRIFSGLDMFGRIQKKLYQIVEELTIAYAIR